LEAPRAAHRTLRRQLLRSLSGLVVCSSVLLVTSVPAQGAIFYRSGTTAQTGSGSSSLAINVPTGVVAGDVMLATVDAEGGTGFTPPSGWSSTGLFNAASNVGWSAVYFHVATSSEPASYSWSLGSSRKAAGKIVSYVGVDNAAPIQTSASAAGTASPATAPTITTTAANEMVVLAAAGRNATAAFTFAPPGSTNDRVETYTTGTGSVVGSDTADFIQATAGATGTKSFTSAPTSTPWRTITAGLKPGTGALAFDIAPDVPALPTVALNGQAQTANATMNNFAVDDTSGSSPSSGSGWNVTVVGDTAAGKSPVFKRYCPNATCGSDTGPGYITGGASLSAGSLKLNSTGASWSGGSGTTPAFQCSSGCSVDAASATKVASAAVNGGLGPWRTSGFSGTSLALSTPTTTRVLPSAEVYRVDLVWSLNSGP
jgi:hypothetical protein